MPHLNSGKVSLHYLDVGEGEVVLWLHAFPLNAEMWTPQLEALGGLRHLAPDDRGFGASVPAADTLTMDMIADDAATILDRLEVPRAVVVGLSMGGYAALSFWRRHRARVRALVLADTRATADSEATRAGRRDFARTAQVEGIAWVTAEIAPKLQRTSPDGEVDMVVRHLIAQASPAGVASAQLGMATRTDSTATIATIDCPALVLVGREDQLTPPSEARALAEGIRGARLVEIPGAGHVANLEAPAAFNAAVATFIGALSD